jgi:hypothetical protein
MNLSELAGALRHLDLDGTANAALAEAASFIGEAVREALSHAPGERHVYPWRQSGTLQGSIEVTAEGPQAAIGSADPVAVWQEHGTSRMPPRPFLAPIAAANAERAAAAIGVAVSGAIGAALGER